MTYHVGMGFSTPDVNHDQTGAPIDSDCAVGCHGAWWYRSCQYSNLNGLYNGTAYGAGINWYYWRGWTYSLKFAQMKIRPVD